MDRWFERLNEQISLAVDETSVRTTLQKLTLEAGFSTYAYFCVRADTPAVISNYPEEWQRRYLKRRYESIDPVILKARSTFEAFAWSNNSTSMMSKERRGFHGEAAEFGIRSGITIPINTGFARRAMLTLASENVSFAEAQSLNPVAAAAAFGQVHSRLEIMRVDPIQRSSVTLKPDELTCLRWSAEGRSMHDIAQIENMSYSNVCFFVLSAKKTLGAKSLPQATAFATKLGLI
jgi:LuxR family transcriptional regulator, activator of conjugal transfer of Ti plasmids